MVNFNLYMSAHIPLGTKDKLASEKFNLPISFVYGDNDWVHVLEGNVSDTIMEANMYKSDKNGVYSSRIHFIPSSDHAMHMENPEALAHTIINDIYDLGLETKPNPHNPEKNDEGDIIVNEKGKLKTPKEVYYQQREKNMKKRGCL